MIRWLLTSSALETAMFYAATIVPLIATLGLAWFVERAFLAKGAANPTAVCEREKGGARVLRRAPRIFRSGR